MTIDREFMNVALEEARAALIHDDVPIGAVVVRDGDVIARRHNERELHGDPTLTDDWNVMDCEVATAHEFVCADLYHAFNGADGTESVATFVSGADYVHPSVAGQAVMAELLENLPLDVLK